MLLFGRGTDVLGGDLLAEKVVVLTHCDGGGWKTWRGVFGAWW